MVRLENSKQLEFLWLHTGDLFSEPASHLCAS